MQRAELTRWLIIVTRLGRTAQRRFVGRGSKAQDTLDEFVIMMVTSKSVVGLKADSLDLHGGSKVFKGGQAISAMEDSQVATRVRIFDIFVTKNSLNKGT